jgi:hypothetical protein
LRYVYLIQSSIEYLSHVHPLSTAIVVHRGFKSGAQKLIPLYHSMIGEVIVWSSFTSTSMHRECVIDQFITDEDSILFEILLHPGDAAACVWDYSRFSSELEVLIAAASGFMVESVESIDVVKQLTIPLVKLSYWMSWYDFDISECPTTIVRESKSLIEKTSSISRSTAITSDRINSSTIQSQKCGRMIGW